MRLRTRLKLTTSFGLVGLAGLSLLLWFFLPDEAREFLRRDAEVRFEKSAARFRSDTMALGEPLRETVRRITADPEVQALSEAGSESLGADAAETAKRLAARYGLSDLAVITTGGILVSVFPEAGRSGTRDEARFLLARQARNEVQLVEPFRRVTRDADADEGDAVGLFAASEATKNGKALVLAGKPLRRKALGEMALRLGSELVVVRTAKEAEAKSATDENVIPFNAADGARVFTAVLKPVGQDSKVIERLLTRRLLILALPWTLLFAFLIVWAGWPKDKEKA